MKIELQKLSSFNLISLIIIIYLCCNLRFEYLYNFSQIFIRNIFKILLLQVDYDISLLDIVKFENLTRESGEIS